jgi:hypothetical protein
MFDKTKADSPVVGIELEVVGSFTEKEITSFDASLIV